MPLVPYIIKVAINIPTIINLLFHHHYKGEGAFSHKKLTRMKIRYNNNVLSMVLGIIVMAVCLMTMSCSAPSVPDNATKTGTLPAIFPDYTEVTIPSNLCPTNFMLPDCEEAVARLSFGSLTFTYGEDNKIIIGEDEWNQLCAAATGDAKGINVEVYGKIGGKWLSYNSFSIYVAKDTIDPYISYRLIQPSYVAYDDLSIAQRNITNYEESDIYNNQIALTEGKGQCINCHSYQNYGTENMLFHARQFKGGTMLLYKGELKKVDLKTDSTISAGVYPAWHPMADLVAFSTNTTNQIFHTKDIAKVEVFDKAADLILYDIAKNEVTSICKTADDLECFPTWSADGKTLYYTSAHFNYADSVANGMKTGERMESVKYNIYSRSFDLATRKFGEQQLVFDAASLGKSATLPRISPDGRYLTFALGGYGCFHVWHKDADICILDLKGHSADGKYPVLSTQGLNSPESESYPSFSSNGRWIMTASRRDDGNYTRPYIAYFDAQGKCHKAFEVPQKNPEYNTLLLRSYNRPEFMKQKVKVTPRQFATKAKEDAVRAKYVDR